MPNYINRPLSRPPISIIVGQGPETLPLLTRIVLDTLKSTKAACTLRIDVETLQASRHIDDDLGYTIESTIEARTAIGQPTHLEIIVHSIRAGKEQAIYSAIQDSPSSASNISEDMGAIPKDETIALSIEDRIYENYTTQQKILKWARRYDTGELLGTMSYRAQPIMGNYELVDIEVAQSEIRPAIHKAIIAPKQVCVHPLNAAALIVPMDIALGGQINRTFTRRWLTSIADPEPITNPREFAEELIHQWKQYRHNINESLREKRLSSIIDEIDCEAQEAGGGNISLN